jgi:antirestriction protein ArdC
MFPKEIKVKAQEIIEQVVNQIIEEIENGTLPWCKPWKTGSAGLNLGGFALPLRHTGEAYRGINILSLWCAASAKGYRARHWMTFRQAIELKGCVRKGEKATGIIYADVSRKTEETPDGETVEKSFAFLKAYSVFNAEQIDGLPEKFYAKTPAPAPAEIIEEPKEVLVIPGQEWLDTVPAVLRHGGDRAYFSPSQDFIQMPQAEAFKSGQAYTSTLIHELTHWTGHKSRLDRLEHKRWGDDHYAFEELVAELGAAFGCANLGLVPAIREDHAPYLSHWLKQLKADPKALMSAAAKASQAIDFLDGYSQATEQKEAA